MRILFYFQSFCAPVTLLGSYQAYSLNFTNAESESLATPDLKIIYRTGMIIITLSVLTCVPQKTKPKTKIFKVMLYWGCSSRKSRVKNSGCITKLAIALQCTQLTAHLTDIDLMCARTAHRGRRGQAMYLLDFPSSPGLHGSKFTPYGSSSLAFPGGITQLLQSL